MKVVTLTAPRKTKVVEKPLPRRTGEYALVKVLVAPMCNEHHAYRNWDFRDRNRPDSLGHEAAGQVIEASPDARVRPGDRVVALSGYPCGHCSLCRAGFYAHCTGPVDPLLACGSVSGECCFAQYVLKADWMLVPIPDGMSYEHAAMACCGLGATFTAMENLLVGPADTLLVTGLGPVGLGAVINGVLRGARVIAAARHPYRAKLAKALGADVVIDPRGEPATQVAALTDGRGADCVVECSAAPIYQRLALDAVRRRGSVAFLGESGELGIHVDRDIIQKGVTLTGSLDLYLPHADPLMALLGRAGPLLDQFITHRFALDQVHHAWETQLTGNCGKIVLHPWQ